MVFIYSSKGMIMDNRSNYSVSNVTDRHVATKEAYLEIYEIVNRRRPYCPSDFKKQHMIPDLD